MGEAQRGDHADQQGQRLLARLRLGSLLRRFPERLVFAGFVLVFLAASGFIYAAGAHLAALPVVVVAAVVILAGVVSCGAAFVRAR